MESIQAAQILKEKYDGMLRNDMRVTFLIEYARVIPESFHPSLANKEKNIPTVDEGQVEGLLYFPDVITQDEEAYLLEAADNLPYEELLYRKIVLHCQE